MYAKVYRGMWDGSLAGTAETWAVFVFLLAHADAEGFVDVHPRVISRLTGFEEPRVVKALGELEAADFSSRSVEAEGARIVRVDEHRTWGWRITNYLKYRSGKDMETVRLQSAARARRFRERHSEHPLHVTLDNAPVTPRNADVTRRNARKRQEEVEVEESKSTPSPEPASRSRARREGYTGEEPPPGFARFWEGYRCSRRVGKPQALAEWKKQGLESDPGPVLAGLEKYRGSTQWREGVMPEPVRWLKKRVWEAVAEMDGGSDGW